MSDNNAGELKGKMTLDTSGFKAGVEETKVASRAVSQQVDADLKRVQQAASTTSTAAGQSLATGVGGSARRMEQAIDQAGDRIVAELKVIQQQMTETKQRAEETEKSTGKLGAGLMSIAGVAGTVHPAVGRVVSGLTAVKGVADSTGISFGKSALLVGGIVAPLMAAGAAASWAAGAIKDGIALAAANEQTAISYEVLTGNVETATKLMGELREFASTTPFRFDEISQAGKQLLAFGVEARDVTQTMRRLGDVSSALNIPLGDMAYLFGTTRVQGRLFTQDLNQFTSRGIPLIDELAKQFGVAKDQVKKLVEEGQVGFENVEKAIVSLTSEGGRFFDMTSRQSQSAAGLWSTLQDTIDELKMSLGEGLIQDDSGKQLLRDLIEEAEKLKPIFVDAGLALAEQLRAALPYIRQMLEQATKLLNYINDIRRVASGQTEKDFIETSTATRDASKMQGLGRDRAGLGEAEKIGSETAAAGGHVRSGLQAILDKTWGPFNEHVFAEETREQAANAIAEIDKLNDALSRVADLRARMDAGEIIPPEQIDAAITDVQRLNDAVAKAQGVAIGIGTSVKEGFNLRRKDAFDFVDEELRISRDYMSKASAMINDLPSIAPNPDEANAATPSPSGGTTPSSTNQTSSSSASSPSTQITPEQRQQAERRRTLDHQAEGRERLAIADARARGDEQEAERLEIIAQAKRQADAAKSADEVLAIERETRQKLIDLERDHQQKQADLQVEAEAARLRALGQHHDAELVEFDARSKKKIEAAKTEAEKLLQIEIYRLERMALIERQQKPNASARQPTNVPDDAVNELREVADAQLSPRERAARERSMRAMNELETRQRVRGGLNRQDQARLDRLRERFTVAGGSAVDRDFEIGGDRAGRERSQRALDQLDQRDAVHGGLSAADEARRGRLRERLGNFDPAGEAMGAYAASKAPQTPNVSVSANAIDIDKLGEVIANKLLPLTRQDLQAALASIRAQNSNAAMGGSL